ncbi:MAG: hypothetical protein ACR2QC_11905 [Gammaproteobacteria bacterium]
MAEEDIFGQPIIPDDGGTLEDPFGGAPDDDVDTGDEGPEEGDAGAEEEEQLTAEGDLPTDPEAIRKHWQAAFTRARQADRTRLGKIEGEHGQYQKVLSQFYQDDAYAKQVLAQRFPELAAQIRGGGQASGSQPTTTPNGLTSELEQNLGDYGFLAKALGPVLERVIDQQVKDRVAPLEQKTTEQVESARKTQEQALLSDMDTKYEGWEESYGAKMRDLDDFLASDALQHPTFGNKYELLYRLLQPDAGRLEAAKDMRNAAKRRSGISRSGRSSAPNIVDQVRKADLSDAEAFQIAARAAAEEVS